MEVTSYDSDKCRRCGLCVTVCMHDVTTFTKGAIPVITNSENCISCGHCVAVCPNGSVAHNRMNMESFKPITPVVVSADEMEDLLSSKRSIRHFSQKPVERVTLERIINAARMSPSVTNKQDRGFVVISDPTTLRRIEQAILNHYRRLLVVLNPAVITVLSLVTPRRAKELGTASMKFRRLLEQAHKNENPVLRAAPAVVVIHAPTRNAASRDDCLAAQHYLMLSAHVMGLGSCINGFIQFAPAPIEKLLDVPKGRRIFAALTLGYPLHKYVRTVDRKPADVRYIV
jgi:nitroreductase/NAD-dependent dihydropyrimidine dehydrogenase PreA subunit